MAGTLTLSCHFSKESTEIEFSVTCQALTQIEIERRIFRCSFDRINKHAVGYGQLRDIPSTSNGALTLTLTLNFPQPGNNACTFLDIHKAVEQNIYTIKTKVSVVCTDGFLRNTSERLKLFVTEGRTLDFLLAFSLNGLLKDKELYLPNDILTLQYELTISSSDPIRSHLEDCNFVPNYLENKGIDNTLSSSNITSKLEEGVLCLREDLQNLFDEQKLCDVVVQTKDRTFPVHKAILCAWSPVFQSMFQLDMKEKESGVVHIDDVDSETMDTFLKYMYTGTLDNLEMDTVFPLYSTADKYQVKSLRNRCSSFLLTKISEDNVCDVLILADLYQDASLKSAAEEVFCANSKNVLLSNEWIILIQKYPNLAAEVLRVMATKM